MLVQTTLGGLMLFTEMVRPNAAAGMPRMNASLGSLVRQFSGGLAPIHVIGVTGLIATFQ